MRKRAPGERRPVDSRRRGALTEQQIDAAVAAMRAEPWFWDLASDYRLRALVADYVRGLTAPLPDAKQARARDAKPATKGPGKADG